MAALFDDDRDYDPSAVEDELFLSEVPQSLMLDAIESQFNHPFERGEQVDYLQTYIRNYTCSIDRIETDEDEVALDQVCDRFVTTIKDFFREYLNIGFPDLDDVKLIDQLETLHLVYRYFITNAKRNINTLVFTKISNDISTLADTYGRRDDILTNSLPDTVPRYVQSVIGNLDVIVDSFLNEEAYDGIDQFVELSHTTGNDLEASTVSNMIDEDRLTGNFIQDYLDKIDGIARTNLISKMRKRLLKAYEIQMPEMSLTDNDEE